MDFLLHAAGTRQFGQLPRQRVEAETPMSDQSPRANRGTSCWAPRLSALDPWLRREAKPEHTLGPGATVGVLGTGIPILACLRPTAWLSQRAVWPIFISKAFKTLARGQASQGGRRKTSSGVAWPGGLTRGEEIKARGTL